MNIGSAWLLNSTDGSGGQTRLDTRLAPIGTMAPDGPLASRGGVIPGSAEGQYLMDGLYVFGDKAGMSALVAPGRAVVQGRPGAGAYPVYISEYTSLTFLDGDPGLPRVDLVVVRVYDDAGTTAAVLEIVQGEYAASPVAPRVPEAALALAEVKVPAGASAGNGGINWTTAVKDLRRPTASVGGIVPAGGPAYRGSYPGQYRDNGGSLERWNGTEWRPYPEPRATWQDYTPAWGQATAGAPVPKLGNGSLWGRYIKDGPVAHFQAAVTIGSTSNWGGPNKNGNWYLSLPVRPAGPRGLTINFRARTGGDPGGYFYGGAEISTAYHPNGVARNWSTIQANGKPTGVWVDADDPMTPLPGSWYEVWGTYEVAP
ncbi:hypothetical protein GCM10010331_06210 [Streptomyces xanthochromogenes]|uniref:hypothetical protein n=1 Tax=Streptomyces TaxID=1883 RepID=UPI00141FF4B6|nr:MULTISPECIES: hypothetical protein [Streptomyces]GHB22705.1 hypothetical protein GCM10010331_06210 [Streptomyces xanthochromogenes]